MKLEGVIVSINYADYLKVTLNNNKQYFNNLVVVTDTKDTATAKVCEMYNVRCIKTDDVYINGSKIPNKGIAINKGLEVLEKDGWVVQLDADIWLPPMFRHILNGLTLHKDCLYGMDRLMCESYWDWMKYLYIDSQPIHEGWVYLHLDRFRMGQRLVQYKGEGYMPIGFFQLWNPNGSNIFSYPIQNQGYDRTDVLHLKQFNKGKRRFIPELVCVHLSNERHTVGRNWKGRNTAPFIPNKYLHEVLSSIGKYVSKLLNFFKCKKLTKYE